VSEKSVKCKKKVSHQLWGITGRENWNASTLR